MDQLKVDRASNGGYVGGQPNGLWNTPPELIYELVEEMQRAGVQMHIHVNGDEASDVSIDAIEAASHKHPWPEARHVLQHCQMMGIDQFSDAQIWVCTNIFVNTFGILGIACAMTIGNDRAERMDAVRAALDPGVNVAIHSDAPVTPMGPPFTAWCAVTVKRCRDVCWARSNASRLRSIARHYPWCGLYIETGLRYRQHRNRKNRDFAILAQDPTEGDGNALKDIEVKGTVSSGVVQRMATGIPLTVRRIFRCG